MSSMGQLSGVEARRAVIIDRLVLPLVYLRLVDRRRDVREAELPPDRARGLGGCLCKAVVAPWIHFLLDEHGARPEGHEVHEDLPEHRGRLAVEDGQLRRRRGRLVGVLDRGLLAPHASDAVDGAVVHQLG
eukprot:CAMPEP_0173391620 /NCGR_PEP_ID=MMETSP1356-20130122/18491_1 /TAXON_ID=77927 ORGANISM="Hemiselmis virescens, Strain PCC157" /NCGR_SAMPLE_ID=MMETSP1356 /ASSEMBLY_ACC=CAM_ASM_000847 /LENGTH=130 /DNA_ID=CAMNT_0014349279 /DNA_START=458 /DNA_END=851 /DNA_ORIENTATION=+